MFTDAYLADRSELGPQYPCDEDEYATLKSQAGDAKNYIEEAISYLHDAYRDLGCNGVLWPDYERDIRDAVGRAMNFELQAIKDKIEAYEDADRWHNSVKREDI